MRSFLLATIFLFAGSTAALAQESSKGDVAATYEWVRANAGPGQCGCFGMNGGGLWASCNFHDRWSLVAEISAQNANRAPTAASSLTLVSYLAGVRYRLPQPWFEGKHKPEPFAQVLVGATHAGGGVAGGGDGSDQFASRGGGGIDLPLSSRFAVRIVPVDYYLTTFANSTNNHQNNLLVAAGFVFRWSR